MSRKPFLHELPDFEVIIQVCSSELQILPYLIEKDYWIMHCLYGLTKQGFNFELKGGTSLSKGFKVIDRFSEDLDIKIIPPASLNVKCGKNQNNPHHIESRRNYFSKLSEDIMIDGIVEVSRDFTYDDKLLRNAGIAFKYEAKNPSVHGIKPVVLLEAGFELTTPNTCVNISSWVRDRALGQIDFEDNQACDIKCYNMEYTFVEKLQTISRKYRQFKHDKSIDANFLRHYYDVYKLLEHEVVIGFIGTREYNEHKDIKFRSVENKDIKSNEAFILSDTSERQTLAENYASNPSLYYKGQVPFEEIVKRIGEFKERL